ncbi:type IV pilus assembly protein PilM [Kineococcus radiotolerans]|uniref:Type IV pilus assembly protein PilM n=1 Tax=Kineococcus radiotolerans TaxID=131568 RepID=A0A7W4TPT5_KINRA|nr:type IV pilus assembly protein PilM [Kineococcus radiotolerans]MBB2902842.1 type IV pilus assembly protein PilM [Kineococcus radiotolerans]
MPGRTAIGLDIGTSGVRAAELSYGRDGITLEKFGQVALPEGAVRDGEVLDRNAVVDAVKTLWKGSGFRGKDVALGVANQRVVVRQVDLPFMPPAELKASLPLHVQDYLPMPVDECVLDFHVTEERRDGETRQLRGLLVAASREMVVSNVQAVQAAGLRVTSVDLTSFAVLRSVARTQADVATEALVDIGARVSNLVIHSDGVPRFVRVLLSGGQDVTDAIAERLGVPAALAEAVKRGAAEDLSDRERDLVQSAVDLMQEVFVDEIRSSIDYYSAANAQFPVERIVVSGGGSLLDGVVERLSVATRRPVVAGNPVSGLHIGRTGLDDDQLAAVQPLAAVPVGLALGVIL